MRVNVASARPYFHHQSSTHGPVSASTGPSLPWSESRASSESATTSGDAMKTQVLFFTVPFVLIAGLAAAEEGPVAGTLRPLADRALEAITAGTASGGAIVGSSSDATIAQTGSVDVRDSAQRDSRALNLVNA